MAYDDRLALADLLANSRLVGEHLRHSAIMDTMATRDVEAMAAELDRHEDAIEAILSHQNGSTYRAVSTG